MSKVKHLAEGMALPEWFLDSLQELICSYASPNFILRQSGATAIQVVAGPNNDQVCVCLGQAGVTGWRFVTATVGASAPGGLPAGTHDIYVTASGNRMAANTTPPPSESDTTNYAFGLAMMQFGTTPSGTAGSAQELYRKVGTFVWSGTQIVSLNQTVGVASPPPPVMLINTLAGSYTLQLSDLNNLVEINAAAPTNLIVPADATANFPVGSLVTVAQLGAGTVLLQAAAGVTLREYNNNLHFAGPSAIVSLIKRAANDWYAAGNLVP